MKKNLLISILMTVATTILFGLLYPLIVTGLAQLIFPYKANGQLIIRHGKVVGSAIIGQGFSGPAYFHSRPSAAGNGYDAANSGGSNLGATNQKLLDRVRADVASAQADNPNAAVPIDLVTTSASGIDPHITPAAGNFRLFVLPRHGGFHPTNCDCSLRSTPKAGSSEYSASRESMSSNSISILPSSSLRMREQQPNSQPDRKGTFDVSAFLNRLDLA